MKPDKIFIGNIKRCTKYISHSRFTGNVFIGEECVNLSSFGYIESEDELYKENAVLVKTKNGGYIDLENFNSILDYLKIYKDDVQRDYNLWKTIMPTHSRGNNSLFVDENSLKPYFNSEDKKEEISIYQLRRRQKVQIKKLLSITKKVTFFISFFHLLLL